MSDSKFYKIGSAVLILLISLIIVLMSLAKKSDNKTAQTKTEEPASVSSSNVIEDTTTSTNDLGQIKEITSEHDSQKENTSTQNNAVTTSNKVESNKSTNLETTSSANEENGNINISDNSAELQNADPVFTYPVEGEISMEYAKDKLVYSNTLGEWITHLGVDIKAEKTTVVKASALGTIKSIKNDPRYGLTVVIEHSNGYTTVYANLLTAEFVSVGESVSSGQTIGTVGNTASFEILDEPHLHFEILKDSEQIDPTMYLKN